MQDHRESQEGDGSQILITGAHGFLGRHAARLFARGGYKVCGIGHGDWSREEWQSWGLSAWYRADVDLKTLRAHAGEPQVIIHCAGSGSVWFSLQHPLEDFERSVVTTTHVLEFVRLHAPQCRVVYPSSASVYGTIRTMPIREDGPLIPMSHYGTHKRMAEKMILSFAQHFGTSAAIVRLFSIYGPGLRKQLLWDACKKIAAQENVFMGTGDEVRDWLHVKDAVTLLKTAAEHASPQCPVVNGASGEGITVRAVIQQLARELHHDPAITFTGKRREGDPERYIADIQKATAWGWKPTTNLNAGLNEYVRWWLGEQR